MIHFTSRAFGTEMCGKVLIKSMSVQPLVKRLHLASDSLAHLCCSAARLIAPHTLSVYCVKWKQLKLRLTLWSVGAPVGDNCFSFFQLNEVSVAMFTEAH